MIQHLTDDAPVLSCATVGIRTREPQTSAIFCTPILGFRHKGLKAVYEDGSGAGVQADHVKKLRRILASLDAAQSAAELMPIPGYKTHSLKGPRKGEWAVWVNGNWRVTCRFKGANVDDLDYEV